MASYTMSALPDLETGTTLEQVNRNLKTVKNWLYQLNEQLKYNLYNLETDNMTQETVDKFTSVSDDVKAELSVLDGKITAAVSSADGRFAALQVSIDGITTQVQDAEGNISQLQQTATSLTSTIQDVQGNVSQIAQSVDSITLGVSNGSTSSTITLYKDGVAITSQAIKITGMVTFSDLAGNGTTTINGANITTGTISADRIAAISRISVGQNYVQCNSSGISIYSAYGGVSIGSPSGGVVVQNELTVQENLTVSGYAYFGLLSSSWKINTDMIERNNAGGITTANAINVGAGSWSATAEGYVYCGKVVENSDSRLKKDITDLNPDECMMLVMSLRPVGFKFIYNDAQEYGFIAQEVRKAESDAGMEDGIVIDTGKRYDEHENTLSMKYDNLLAPIVKVIQMQQAEIYALKEAIGIGKAG